MLDKVIGFFTGGSKTAGKIVDVGADIVGGVQSGIDMWKLTDEERIQYTQGGFKLHLKFMEQNVEQSSLRSQARREIAKAIVYTQLYMIIAIGLVWKYDSKWADFLMKLNTESKLAVAFVAVIVFYFGYYGIQGAIAKAKGSS